MIKSSEKPHARKKLEIPMEAAMPCKQKTTKCSHRHREIDSGSNKIQKSKNACIVEAQESTRRRVEGTLSQDHEDHIAEKGVNSLRDENFRCTCCVWCCVVCCVCVVFVLCLCCVCVVFVLCLCCVCCVCVVCVSVGVLGKSHTLMYSESAACAIHVE